MKYVVSSREEQPVWNWNGGSTQQLAIFPAGSSFEERNFLFRISTASVDVDDALFTPFPGMKRIIMVLDGELQMFHEGQYGKRLGKFDTDEFLGDWKTRSHGKAIDFNLIMTKKCEGKVEGVMIGEDEQMEFPMKKQTGVYVLKNDIFFEPERENIHMNEGDFILMSEPVRKSFKIKSLFGAEIVLVQVWQ